MLQAHTVSFLSVLESSVSPKMPGSVSRGVEESLPQLCVCRGAGPPGLLEGRLLASGSLLMRLC